MLSESSFRILTGQPRKQDTIEGDHVDEKRRDPGCGLCKGGSQETDLPHKEDDDQDPHDHFHDAGEHGDERMSHTLYTASVDEKEVDCDETDSGNGEVLYGQ